MAAPLPLQPADEVSLTVLVDNSSDLFAPPGEGVERPRLAGGPTVLNPQWDGAGPAALRAEHGFSALVRVRVGGRERVLLFDAGISREGLMHNADLLGVDLRDAAAVVLSHGHFDHTGGLAGLVVRLRPRELPLFIHPEGFLSRRIEPRDLPPVPLPPPSRAALRDAGLEVVEGAAPALLLDGAAAITGEVPRATEFERGMPAHFAWRDGRWEADPLVRDDQGLVVNVRGEGLLVLTGCGHAGVVNIVRHAQALTGVERVLAVVGGFHLPSPAFDHAIGPTVAELAGLAPARVIPAHCTGWRAQQLLAQALPDAFVPPSVGSTYRF